MTRRGQSSELAGRPSTSAGLSVEYSEGDLRAIAQASRTSRSSAAVPELYVLVLEGRYENEPVTGGTFGATGCAIFPDQSAFHEDDQHSGHSRHRGSVMFWAVEDVSVRNVFTGGAPTEFDSADEEEMSRIRSSR